MSSRAKEAAFSEEGLEAAEERQSAQESFEGEDGDPESVEVFRDPGLHTKRHTRDGM